MAYTEQVTITLNGSGAITAEPLTNAPNGYIEAIRIGKGGQTADPAIDIDMAGGFTEKILDVTTTADTVYPIRRTLVSNQGSAITNSHGRYLVETPLTITVTGGDADGTLTVAFQYTPVYGG